MKFIDLYNLISENESLGLIEDLEIDGIGKVKAKTDTGNEDVLSSSFDGKNFS